MILSTIEVAGKRLEVATWRSDHGRGLPILLLHEGLGSIRLWKAFPEELAAKTGRTVIAWSRRGHGSSDARDDAHTVNYMHREADFLPDIHHQLGIERAHWFGHSDGASIALIGASRTQQFCSSLILEAPHVLVEDLTYESIAKVTAGFTQSDMGERMRRYHEEPYPLFRDWSAIWLSPEFREWNIEDVLSRIDKPMLLIQGRNDQYGTMDQLDRIVRAVPRAIKVEIDDCGHSPHLEQEQRVLEAVCDFLKDKE